MTETLYIATVIANPLKWNSRIDLAKKAVQSWLKEPNVKVYLVECLYGTDENYLLTLDDNKNENYTHIKVKANTPPWSKENLLNIAVSHMPSNAQKIAFFDADVTYRKSGWVEHILHALNLYVVVQPWTQAIDLGPNDEVLFVHTSFANINHYQKPIIPIGTKFWTDSKYSYPHPGYAWAWQRNSLDFVGGLYQYAGMGAADHTMAVAMIGRYKLGIQKDMGDNYRHSVAQWSNRAYDHIKGKIGYTLDTIEHPFHGKKSNRGYQSRWDIFVEAGFDPTTDLKINSYGVLEFAGNKPQLELKWINYLKSRDEDTNNL